MKATSGTSRRLPTGLHRSGGDGGCTFGHWGGRQRIVGVLHWTVCDPGCTRGRGVRGWRTAREF